MLKKIKLPLVSIIIPAYNAERFVAQSIESMLAQTYKNIEIIVVDDGSADKTYSVAKRYERKNPKVKVILHKKNQGEPFAANTAFRATRGEFIARMDADDIAYPERIELQVNYMLAHPEIILLGTQAQVIDENGQVTGKKTFPLTHDKIYKAYATYHPVLHPACMFRRSLLPHKDRLMDVGYAPNDDYNTFFGFLRYGKFANLPQTLMGYRVHGSNISLVHARSKVYNFMRIRTRAVLKLGYKPTPLSILVCGLQALFVTIMPEAWIVPAYSVFRGMLSFEYILEKIRSVGRTKPSTALSPATSTE